MVNILLDHITGLRTLCAASETFQGLVGAADATEAADSIFIYETTPPDDDVWAVVSDPDEDGLRLTEVTGPASYDGVRSAQLTLFQFVDDWSSAAAAQFLQDTSNVWRDILTLQGEDAYLYINTAIKVSSQTLPFRFQEGGRRGYMLAMIFGQTLYG